VSGAYTLNFRAIEQFGHRWMNMSNWRSFGVE